jgi:hypothetical protein
MRNEPVVNVPAALCDNVDFGSVIIRSGSCGDIVRAYKALGDRIVGVELERLSDDVSLLSALPQGLSLTLKLRPMEAANVYTSSWLSDRFALAALMDVEKGLLEGVKIVTSAQVPVVINLDSLSDDSELISVLDYYLHDRHLQVPIEFFHSLFAARKVLRLDHGRPADRPGIGPLPDADQSQEESLFIGFLVRIVRSVRCLRWLSPHH